VHASSSWAHASLSPGLLGLCPSSGTAATTHPLVLSIASMCPAGALTATFVCPLDVLKTRLQVQRIANTQRVGIIGAYLSFATWRHVRSSRTQQYQQQLGRRVEQLRMLC
jgi:hypothetical protein